MGAPFLKIDHLILIMYLSFSFVLHKHSNPEPTLVEMKSIGNCRWFKIACGGAHYRKHTIALTKDGKVYRWQEGDRIRKPSITPTQVMSLAGAKVVHVSIGRQYAAAVTGDGVLYTWWVKQAI